MALITVASRTACLVNPPPNCRGLVLPPHDSLAHANGIGCRRRGLLVTHVPHNMANQREPCDRGRGGTNLFRNSR
jgi:hypothetical protein